MSGASTKNVRVVVQGCTQRLLDRKVDASVRAPANSFVFGLQRFRLRRVTGTAGNHGQYITDASANLLSGMCHNAMLYYPQRLAFSTTSCPKFCSAVPTSGNPSHNQ